MAHRPNFNSINYKRSFTLLETMVAIYILLTGIVGSMSAVAQSLASVSIFKDQLIASNLAQEGVELVRNKRDSNFFQESSPGSSCSFAGDPPCDPNYNNFKDIVGAAGCDSPNGCRVSDAGITGVPSFVACDTLEGAGTCNSVGPLRTDSEGLYGYNGTPTKYDRRIFVSPQTLRHTTDVLGTPKPYNDYEVRSRVTWRDKFTDRHIEVVGVFTPWLSN